VIDLPAGSTPIDFAYHVHTSVGDRCRGAKVNGKLVPLDYVIRTGEQVEVLTSKQGGPSRDWLNPSLGLVRTASARGKIRNWFKRQDREQNLAQGRVMLERELQRLGLPPLDDQALAALARNFDRAVDDFYVALGCGDVTVGRVLNKILETKEPDDSLVVVPSTSEATVSDAVTVLGLKGLMTTTARCCNPTAGDQIIGYITRGHGATIHRQDCPNILRIRDRERLVKVSWGLNVRTYPVPIRITAYDRQGLMGDITTLVEKAQAQFDEEQARKLEKKIRKNQFDFQDFLDQLQQIKKMGSLKDLMSMIPGVGKAMKDVDISDDAFKGVEAIIHSMTPFERSNPDIIDMNRKKRIAKGCGKDIADVNQFMKQFEQMREMMKSMNRMPMAGRMGMGRR